MRSIRSWILPAALALAAGGCTYDELRKDTANVETTMADLRYKGILNNLAMMVNNPASLPNPVAVSTGSVQVSDSGNIGVPATFIPHGPLNGYGLNNQLARQVTEQWALQPLHKPAKLMMMRCAFQILLDVPPSPCTDPACGPDCGKLLHDFLAEQDTSPNLACAIPRGWFSVGRKCDVPHNASFVGHYNDTYVWVMPDGIDGLSRFTLTILRIALTDYTVPTVTVVREFNGDGKLTKYTVNDTEVLPGFLPDKPRPIIQTGEVPAISGGIQFVPTPPR